MTPEQREKVEDLRAMLQKLEEEERVQEAELQKIRTQKALLQAEIARNSDSAYEQNALQLLYEQRRRK